MNLEKCFKALGVDANDSPSPTTKGLAKEGTSLIGKTNDSLKDTVVLAAALGTEHYEISAYETLITSADAMGADEVVQLLKENLAQEQHASEELNAAAKKVAAAAA
jgi:ferritin-like metal-binding protein YciE